MSELVANCLAGAQQKEQQGDYRGAFLACQALLIDQFENIPPLALASLYGYMARVSELQGLSERAAKYRQKASLLRRQAKGEAQPQPAAATPAAESAPAATAPAGAPSAPPPQQRQSTPPSAPPAVEPPPATAAPPEQPPTEAAPAREVSAPPSPPPGPPPQPQAPIPPSTPAPPASDLASALAASTAAPESAPHEAPAQPEPGSAILPAGEPEPAVGAVAGAVSRGGTVLVAGFWKRTLAFLLDLALVLAVTLGALSISSLLLAGGLSAALGFFGEKLSRLLLGLGLLSLFLLAYQAVFTRYGGQTAGQMLLRLKVVGPNGRSPDLWLTTRRSLGLVLAALPGLAGLLWMAFDRQRRGWHDHLGRSLVVDLGAMQRLQQAEAGERDR